MYFVYSINLVTTHSWYNFHLTFKFASKVWWTRGEKQDDIWHLADTSDIWFVFDPTLNENATTDRVTLQTYNWMNGKQEKSAQLLQICEMGKLE